MSGGILARGDFVLGGFWLGGFCLGGFCPGGFCPGGFCPGGFCPRTLGTASRLLGYFPHPCGVISAFKLFIKLTPAERNSADDKLQCEV